MTSSRPEELLNLHCRRPEQLGCVRIYRRDGEQTGAIQMLRDEQFAVVAADGHWRGSERAAEHLHYVVLTDAGERLTLTPTEFAARFGHQNDPDRVRLIPETAAGTE